MNIFHTLSSDTTPHHFLVNFSRTCPACIFRWLLTRAFNGLWLSEVVINPVDSSSSHSVLVFHTNLTASLPTLSPFLALRPICSFCGFYLSSFCLCLSAYVCLYFVCVLLSASHLFYFSLLTVQPLKSALPWQPQKIWKMWKDVEVWLKRTYILFNKCDVVTSKVGHTW